MSRQRRRTRGAYRQQRNQSPRIEVRQEPPEPLHDGVIETDPAKLALKLILTQLHDDGTGRAMPIVGQLIPLFEAREWGTVAGAIGYLLANMVDGLVAGCGSRAAAIDTVMTQLLEASDG